MIFFLPKMLFTANRLQAKKIFFEKGYFFLKKTLKTFCNGISPLIKTADIFTILALVLSYA